jgi:hypothetical protein
LVAHGDERDDADEHVQRNEAEAEPLLMSGSGGLKALEAKIPAPFKARLTQADGQVVQPYEF